MSDEDKGKWEKLVDEEPLEDEQVIENEEEPAELELTSRDTLEEELNAAIEKSLRAQAELQNMRKRTDEDMRRARLFALEDFAKALLPILDSLDQGLAIEMDDQDVAKSLHEGMELTHKLFIDTLSKYHIQVIDPQGESFDPHLHEAMSKVPSEDVDAGSVITVIQKGYLLHDRLLRPARVIIAG